MSHRPEHNGPVDGFTHAADRPCMSQRTMPRGAQGRERMGKLDLYLLMLGYVLLFLWLIAWLLG